MSDNVGPKELSNAFKYLLAYQLDSIASDGVMPSAHGALHKLLCSCYSKNTEVVDIYDMPGDLQENQRSSPYTKRAAIEGAENNNKKTTPISFPTSSSPSPAPSTLPVATSSELMSIRKTEDFGAKKRKEEDAKMRNMKKNYRKEEEKTSSPIIVEVYDDTPHSKMMLSTVNNPYRGGNNTSNNNNSNHRMVIEDVTDDPEYSSYGNENEKPENEEEGAFVEYEKLDKTEDPAAYKVCQSTTAVNRTYNNIRPSYRMPIGSGSSSSLSRMEIRIDSMNLSDVEDGARCRDKECRLGWKQHPWRCHVNKTKRGIIPFPKMRAMVRGMVGRGKKKEKNGGVANAPLNSNNSNSNTKHAKIQPSFSCSPPIERKETKPQPIQASLADHSIGSPPQARRPPPKRVPSGKGTSSGHSGVVKTDLAVKVCVHCKSDRADHELPPNQALNVYNRLGIQPPAGMPQSGVAEVEVPGSVGHGYAWVPPGLSRKKVEEYMSQLPNNVVPRTNSSGEKLREKQLLVQLPRQDLSVAYCRHLTTQTERKVYEEFVNARNEIALDIGYVSSNINKAMECHKCSGILETNEMAVIAPKLGDTTGWHPACFTCQTCEQLLVDLTYCVKDNQIYCERHYAELHKPRCSACDELIFAGEYTKAMNKDWHSDHFCCWQCDQTLTGQRYIMRDEQPYCIKCYEDVFANQCDECAKPIGIDSKDLSYKDKHWHEHCFLCSMCKISLVDMPFGSKNDRIFCSNCYDQAFATRCDGCNEIFRAGMKKMEYKGKQWHDKCFCCAHCKVAIGTKSFIPKNDDVFCGPCYEEKFATRCSKCKKVITAGGVTYKNEPWHRECFCCTNCNSSLAGQRFTSKDEKPYCANCYGDLFAKRCNACTKPITGIGGAKFISFEDRHWHNDCFICAQCTTSLVGKGFITDGHEILCPECAKARLMAANS